MAKDLVLTHEKNESAILLFHGLTGNPQEMSYLAKRLFQAGYDVHCPILPGHVSGIGGVITASWQSWMRFGLAAYDELASSYKRVFVGGTCFGVVLAGLVAAERDSVPGVFMHGPTLFPDGWNRPWYHLFIHVVIRTPLKYCCVFTERPPFGVKDPKVRETIEESFKNKDENLDCFPLATIGELVRFGNVFKRRGRAIHAPILICHAREDDLASLNNAEIVYKTVSSTSKRLVVLEDSYHLIAIDNDRRKVATETLSFLGALQEQEAS